MDVEHASNCGNPIGIAAGAIGYLEAIEKAVLRALQGP